MKKIKDERLIIQNLKNIRIAFIVQTIGIIAILIYHGIIEGVREVTKHPLWFVFMITMIVFLLLHIKISQDVYEEADGVKKPAPYYRVVLLSMVVGIFFAILTKLGPDKSSNTEALIIGGVFFICFFLAFSFVHFLKKKRYNDQ
ncbi:hypothetical protein ACS127_10685 [Amphibacillus sp. Q70]|uniref:hypothetical protein n=1 Tax=Amphibacillus sp. Q70 TaxID=3453416 RepID=UPI003F83148C